MTAANLRELIEGDALTDREVEVLYGVAKGETAGGTGDRLYLAPETVKDYRKKLIAKLGAKNLCHATAIAIGNGVLDISRILDDD